MPVAVRFVLPAALAVVAAVFLPDVSSPRTAAAAPPVAPVAADTGVTTMDGVYTLAQATRGRDVFASSCQSCHTPTQHAGPPFRNKWFGRTLGELYGYIRREMPKNEPGSMSDEEYALSLAYLLRMNGMPTGSKPLAADSAALHRIRLDSVRAVPSTPNPRR
ncbi:MAG: cytochrome c [Gemmatimonadota bacterium]